jgi:hypothetical protein
MTAAAKLKKPARELRDVGGRPKNHIAQNRLRELRERHKAKGGLWLTTAEVATLTGIGEADVSRHENHVRALTEEHVRAYAKVYKVSSHQLFTNLTIAK